MSRVPDVSYQAAVDDVLQFSNTFGLRTFKGQRERVTEKYVSLDKCPSDSEQV